MTDRCPLCSAGVLMYGRCSNAIECGLSERNWPAVQALKDEIRLNHQKITRIEEENARLKTELEKVTDERDRQYDENVARIAAEGKACLERDVALDRIAELEAENDRLRINPKRSYCTKPCTDCHFDWGHSYCGVCDGKGYVLDHEAERLKVEEEKGEIARLKAELAAVKLEPYT